MVLMFMTIFFSGNSSHSSEVHLGRMLQILREFSADPILSAYVIDDIWEYMSAMKVRLYTLWEFFSSNVIILVLHLIDFLCILMHST